MKAALLDELFVLLAHGARETIQSQLRDVTSSLDSELLPRKGEHERERTEVITLREVRAHRAGESPELSVRMRECLLVGEEVAVTLHRDAKPLGKDVVTVCRCFLGSFDFLMVGLVGYCLPEVRLGFDPHGWVVDLLDLIQLVVEDRDMWSDVVALEDVHQFHFDGIAGTVTDGAFRAHGHDQIVREFGRSLLDRADDVLSEVSGQPLVNRIDLGSKALKLVDRHRPDFEQRTGQEVLDALLGGHELLSTGPGARGVLQGPVRQELEQWSTTSSDRSPDRRHDFFGLFHGRGSRDLMGRVGIDVEEVALKA